MTINKRFICFLLFWIPATSVVLGQLNMSNDVKGLDTIAYKIIYEPSDSLTAKFHNPDHLIITSLIDSTESILYNFDGSIDTFHNTKFFPEFINKYKGKIKLERNGKQAIYSLDRKKIFTPFHKEIKILSDCHYLVLDGNIKTLYNYENELIVTNVEGKLNYLSLLDELKCSFYGTIDSLHGVFSSSGELVSISPRNVTNILNPNVRNSFNRHNIIVENGLYGVLNSKGNVAVKPKYSFMLPWNSKYFIVEQDEKYGLINTKGKVLIPIKHGVIQSRGNFLKIYNKNDVKILDDQLRNVKNGKWKNAYVNNEILITYFDGDRYSYLATFSDHYKEFENNIDSIIVVGKSFLRVNRTNQISEIYCKTGQKFFSGKLNQVFLNPTKSGLLIIENRANKTWSVFDSKGGVVLPPTKNRIRRIQLLGGFYIIDSDTGKNHLYTSSGLLVDTQLEGSIGGYKNYRVTKNGKQSFYSDDGDLLIPFIFEYVREFPNLRIFFTYRDNGNYKGSRGLLQVFE